MGDKAQRIESVCRALQAGRVDFARQVIGRSYAFDPRAELDELPVARAARQFRPAGQKRVVAKPRGGVDRAQELRVWRRDRFHDRYSGERLVFPGTLILLSVVLRDLVPYPDPPHAKRERSHQMMLELYPVLDHVVSPSRPEQLRAAGIAEPEGDGNLVTTSAANHTAKASARLVEIGWTLREVPEASEWDGLAVWFLDYVARDPNPLADSMHGATLEGWRGLLGA